MIINKFGYDWTIRDTGNLPEGPGNNIFTYLNVAENNGLILNVNKDGCSEIYLDKSLGYGLYEFELECRPCLSKGIVCGVFLYKDDENEIDIELSRWNKLFSKNAQFVLQKTGEKFRFWNFESNNKLSIDFRADSITLTLNNKKCVFNNTIDVTACVHVNLWKYGDPTDESVVLTNFKFTP